MKKSLVTMAVGEEARDELEVSLPTFQRYAEFHGYEIDIISECVDGRPPAWTKIDAIYQRLNWFDVVLWLDSDLLILRPDRDISEALLWFDSFQALAVEPDGIRDVNTGVWLVRGRDPRSGEFLRQAWAQGDLSEHRTWDQWAVRRLLFRDAQWREGTHFLPALWNDWSWAYVKPIIRHYGGRKAERRLERMKTDAAELAIAS